MDSARDAHTYKAHGLSAPPPPSPPPPLLLPRTAWLVSTTGLALAELALAELVLELEPAARQAKRVTGPR